MSITTIIQDIITGFSILPYGETIAFVVLLIGWTIILKIISWILIKIFNIMANKTVTTLDDRIAKVLSDHLPIIGFLTALWFAVDSVYPNLRILSYSVFEVYIILLLVLCAFLSGAIIDSFLVWYGSEIQSHKNRRDEDIFPFVRNVVRIVVVLIFVTFILQKLGVETNAILTGLGVGGLAVALGLQDTLSNFFSGIHILVDKPFREGDIIKMENGFEGTVKRIGWRSTRIIAYPNNEVIVPNSRLAGAILENFSARDMFGVWYSIDVDYREDVQEVDRIITETLKKVAEKELNLDKNTIWVRFDIFAEYKLNFKFGYMVKGYPNRWGILKTVNTELFYAFKKNKIKMPVPNRILVQDNLKMS